nr:transcriptional regulator [Halorientalis brevis]
MKLSAVVAKNDPREDEKLEVQLIHTHLPRLDDMDYIGWNRDHGTIVKGSNWEEIEPVVRLLRNNREQIPPDTF